MKFALLLLIFAWIPGIFSRSPTNANSISTSSTSSIAKVELRKLPVWSPRSKFIRLSLALHSVYPASSLTLIIGVSHWICGTDPESPSSPSSSAFKSTPLSLSKYQKLSNTKHKLEIDIPFDYYQNQQLQDKLYIKHAFTQGLQISLKMEATYADNLLYSAHLATPLLNSLGKSRWLDRFKNIPKATLIRSADETKQFYSDLPLPQLHYQPIMETHFKKQSLDEIMKTNSPSFYSSSNIIILNNPVKAQTIGTEVNSITRKDKMDDPNSSITFNISEIPRRRLKPALEAILEEPSTNEPLLSAHSSPLPTVEHFGKKANAKIPRSQSFNSKLLEVGAGCDLLRSSLTVTKSPVLKSFGRPILRDRKDDGSDG